MPTSRHVQSRLYGLKPMPFFQIKSTQAYRASKCIYPLLLIFELSLCIIPLPKEFSTAKYYKVQLSNLYRFFQHDMSYLNMFAVVMSHCIIKSHKTNDQKKL